MLRKINIKNKKGFLLGEFSLKVIIAIICILLLIYLLGRLYFNQQLSAEEEQAGATLDSIVAALPKAKDNPGQEITMTVYNPEGWVIVFWDKTHDRPETCFDKSCICVCKKLSDEKMKIFFIGSAYDPPQYRACEMHSSICKPLNQVMNYGRVQIKPGKQIKIKYENGEYDFYE